MSLWQLKEVCEILHRNKIAEKSIEAGRGLIDTIHFMCDKEEMKKIGQKDLTRLHALNCYKTKESFVFYF
jgi:hypothetical protein